MSVVFLNVVYRSHRDLQFDVRGFQSHKTSGNL